MGVPELLTLWPSGVAHGAWSWIADNLSGGDPGRGETGRGETGRGETGSGDGARSGLAGSRFSVDLAGPDWASIAVTDLSGEATAAGLTVRYLGELPVATDASGRLRFSLDAITIDGLRGRVGALAVREGRITFTDFDAPVERAAMTFQIEGPLSSALALIDHQPLGYASQVGLDPARAAGDVDTTLTVALPLLKDVALEDVAIGVAAEATGVGLPDVALGQDLTDGDLSLTLDNAGLDVTGRARLGGVAASLDWRENFTAGAAFDRRYVVRGRADTAARARFGLDGPPFAPPWLDGPVDVDLTYTEIAGQPGVLQARVDLTPATMAMPDLDWVKPAGEEGTVSIEGRFGDHAMTVGFDLFAVPGQATVTGEARLDGAGERLRGLTLSRVRLGRTEARAEIVAPASAGAPWRVGLTGAALDATVLLSDDDAEEAGAGTSGGGPAAPVVTAQGDAEDEAPGPPLDVSLDVERLLLSDNITLHAARVGLTRDGAGVWRKARVDGRIQGGPPVSLRLDPGADGLRRFTLTADDAGAVARALDITRSLRGGRMTLTGTLDEAGVARGRLEAANVFLTKVPVLVRLLAVASLTGILEELQGEGLSLSTLVVPFTYADPRLTLNAARANGPSLGLTANGTLDLDAETMDLEGVVVPAYLVNSLLGRIPVVGNLLVGEKGGGVFAVDYSAEGPMDDPRIAVNPLTLLTPGILREVFGVIPDGVDEGGVDEGGVEEDEAQPPRSFERGLD
nr:AsmA-like C-terminal domain-containing protein [Roseospira visakhapatnamensis]